MTKPPSFDQVCAKALQLPCSPALLPRLTAVMNNADSTAADLEEIIRLDPPLASSTLRISNSAYFASSVPVETISEAILRLGHKEIYRLAALSLAGRWMNVSVDGYCWEAGDFCRHSLSRAIAAEHLAERTKLVDTGLAYTAGLICTAGKLAIAYACGEWFGPIRERQQADGCTWIEAERAVLGYDYAQAGARLLQVWRFPASLVAAAEFQLKPAGAPEELRPLLAVLHAAQYLATAMGAGVTEDGFLYEINGEFLTAFGITEDVLTHALPVVLERALSILQDRLLVGKVKF
jgi:HD-like signal output (HDOD) protein